MWVNIKPFEPSASMNDLPECLSLPAGQPVADVHRLWHCQITGTTELTFGIPLAINTWLTPVVAFDDPCCGCDFRWRSGWDQYLLLRQGHALPGYL